MVERLLEMCQEERHCLQEEMTTCYQGIMDTLLKTGKEKKQNC